MIIYSKGSGVADSALGKYSTPIKMILEHESDLMKKKGGICDWLFNVEKSNHFGEGIVNQTGFNIFNAVAEGEGAEKDLVRDAGTKFIEHVQFMKEFSITAEMMEDAVGGIASDAKRRIQNFVRAYYGTINKLCSQMLIGGTGSSVTYAGATLDSTTHDKKPLFSATHTYGVAGGDVTGTQSNYFYGSAFKVGEEYSAELIENTLYTMANKVRSMKDDLGDPLGYVADTVILPVNKPALELLVKKICGSLGTVGTANNDINIHYGNWNVIVLPTWAPEKDEIMVMSSEANKALAGNMFFNRVPLTVTDWIDHHTGNYNWTGRCRFGVGFGSYKHIARVVDSASAVQNASALEA